ncbi:unnamed protein product [Phytophthora fragariaefolia]|uniref:Unnamed protein product n=1 Tax=Phytophthora fragariaefolia TaxID=1490495 RepID=A0A9W7CYH8_9STRA|nr:unnamed protein product [Phytophthora fragariaefolia]
MPVFWPACVYSSYSAAVAHAHDLWALRQDKPALDSEDRVLYFFGVGPRACHVLAAGSAPNLQLCVAHEDDMTLADWTRAGDFPALCGQLQLPPDAVARAQTNACFVRACEEAEAYARDVRTDEQASELFVTLLTMAKKAHKTGRAVVAREIIASPNTTPVKAVPANAGEAKQQRAEKKARDVAKMLKAPEMTAMVAKCWQQMLQTGWETMAQGDGQVLYKMPGVSFFDFVPNVNLFDSLEKACARYLTEWVKSTAVEASDSKEFSEMTDFIWPMAAGSGWESMSTPTETLYKKKDTPFDQWVPNVTIFRSKAQAVARYLEETGLIDSTSEDERNISAQQDAADSDAEMEEPEQSESEASEPEQSESEDEELSQAADNSEDNQSKVEEAPVKKAPTKKKAAPPSKSTPKPQPSKPIKKTPVQKSQPTVNQKKKSKLIPVDIPPFKMTFGKLEAELKNRGWYWKNGGLHWLYYQPYCKTKSANSLKPNEDYFRGREELEAYIEESGLYAHIHEKLKEEHVIQFMEDSEDEVVTRKAKASVRSQPTSRAQPKKLQPKEATTKKAPVKMSQKRDIPSQRRGSESASRIRRARSKSKPRSAGNGLSCQTTLAEVKFGEIWRVLTDDGWHYKWGSIECDYFMPHCQSVKDGVGGVDFFHSKAELIEYLQTSGVWDKTALRVRAQAAMDSSDEDIEDSDVDTATPAPKRKRDERTPAPRQGNKKQKDSFRTPNVDKRSIYYISDDDEEMEETISPDAAGNKGKENLSRGNARQPLRNLANSFTPSPNVEWKEKSSKRSTALSEDLSMEPVMDESPKPMLLSAIQKLTSAYIPPNFRHREKEFDEIRSFFRDCFEEKEKTSLYISGAPGCGKTALLKSTQADINKLYRIDTLLKNNGVENDLCRLFELAHRASNSFILIGIANQVDFTERHLPLLQQRLPDCSPRVVIFEPYKHQTIEQILIDRLGGATAAPKMVSIHGISFLARKIASTSGDIRLAVDTCRRVLQHKLDQADKENSENPVDEKELARPLPLTDTLRIIKHALESKSAMAIRSLPRNLQMILFASTRLLIVTANRAAANGSEATPLLSADELYACYCEVSKDAGVFKPLAERDFRTALDTLGEEGLIAEAELRKHLIKLQFSTSELLQSFRKDPFFSRLV